MMIVLVGMIGCCASGALVLVMIVVMIVVKCLIRWSMSGGRHMFLAYLGCIHAGGDSWATFNQIGIVLSGT